MSIEAACAVADQVPSDLLKQGLLYRLQSNILETEIRTAARVAKLVFDSGLARVARPKDMVEFIRAAGLSKLALNFALPASLFVSMTDIRRDLLLQQGRLVLALFLAHTGLFEVAWLLLRLVPSLHGTPSIIYALMLATSATPVFGLPSSSRYWVRPAQGR